MKKILIVDDEEMIREVLREYAEFEGYEAFEAENGREAVQMCKENNYDIILMDVMMPKLDGFSAVKEIKKFKDIPVIMATAKGSEYDKIQSLDLGADDYLVKPFGIMEMVSRIKAVLRRYKPAKQTNLLQLGGLVLNPAEHTVELDGDRLVLTHKEYELLYLFLSQPGIAFTREQLLSKVWNIEYMGETRTVDMHIRTLRQKLGRYGNIIETVRNVGYRLETKNDK